MAASASPSGVQSDNNNGNINNKKCSGGGKENANGDAVKSNGGGLSVTENSAAGPAQTTLRHNPGISLDWTPEEQSTLEDLLAKYASETTIVRYAKIAQALQEKTVRDVALRCRWMNKKENGKRRKDDQNSSKKNKDKKVDLTNKREVQIISFEKEKTTDLLPKSSQVPNRSNDPPYVTSMMSMDSDDGISYKMIGGTCGRLLEQNAQALDQISSNFAAFKFHENINLFCQARNNILSILNDCSDMPEVMKQMPPLPVRLNEDLANTILPRTVLPNESRGPC